MARRKAFETGWTAKEAPSPDEVAALGTRMQILQGQAQGYAQRQIAQITQTLQTAEYAADGAYERIGEMIGNELGDTQMVAQATDLKAQQAMQQALVPPAQTALSYGYEARGVIGTGKGGRKGRRKRKPRSDGPPDDPETAPTPLPTGEGALPFDPASAPPLTSSGVQQWTVIVNCRTSEVYILAGGLDYWHAQGYQFGGDYRVGPTLSGTQEQVSTFLATNGPQTVASVCAAR
jgi:hypothetical protein